MPAKKKRKNRRTLRYFSKWRKYLFGLSLAVNVILIITILVFTVDYYTGNKTAPAALDNLSFDYCRHNITKYGIYPSKTLKQNGVVVNIFRVPADVENSECLGYLISSSEVGYYIYNPAAAANLAKSYGNSYQVYVGPDGKLVNTYLNTSQFDLPPLK